MEIEKISLQSNNNKNIEPMEEEKEIHQMNDSEFQKQNKKKEANKSIESNRSISTNNSINNISMDKIINDLNNKDEDLLTIFKIDKIDKKQQIYKHYFIEEYLDEMYTNFILDEKKNKNK